MKIQADIPEDLNKELKIVKIREGHNTIQESLSFVLEDYFKEKGVLKNGK